MFFVFFRPSKLLELLACIVERLKILIAKYGGIATQVYDSFADRFRERWTHEQSLLQGGPQLPRTQHGRLRLRTWDCGATPLASRFVTTIHKPCGLTRFTMEFFSNAC